MANQRIEFMLSDPEFRALAEFAVRNETAMTRPDNFKTAVHALTVRGWPHDQAHELMMAFGKQLDTVNAKVHAAAHRTDQDPDRYPHPDAEA